MSKNSSDTNGVVGGGLLPYGLQDLEQVRLVLDGDSVVDWRKLALGDLMAVNVLLERQGIDVNNSNDVFAPELHSRNGHGLFAKELRSPALRGGGET